MPDEQSELERQIVELTLLLRENSDLSPEWQRAVAQEIAWCRARLAVLRRRQGSQQRLDSRLSDDRYSERESF